MITLSMVTLLSGLVQSRRENGGGGGGGGRTHWISLPSRFSSPLLIELVELLNETRNKKGNAKCVKKIKKSYMNYIKDRYFCIRDLGPL